MGKILKYCGSCDEGFADKFAFCPNCGATLQAFEMNPVQSEPQPPVTREVAAEPPAPAFIEPPAEVETSPTDELLAIEAAAPHEVEVYEQPAIETSEVREPAAEEA